MEDLCAIKCILCYIKWTLTHSLHYLSQSSLTLNDVDWVSCPTTRGSTTKFCIFLELNCVVWASKKQPTLSWCNTKVEYRSLATVATEIEYLFLYDNTSVIHLVHNLALHACMKHIEIDSHYIREKVTVNALHIWHLPTKNQIAYIFRKTLWKESF